MNKYNYEESFRELMELGKIEIRTMPVGKLNPAKYNPRKDLTPEDPEYQKLEKEILVNGYVDPIIWNETTGNMVGGHQRYKILVANGCKEIDVSVVHMAETEEKALNIALNKVSGLWDEDKLKNLFLEFQTTDIDLLLTGFDIPEINSILEEAIDENFIDEILNEGFITSKSNSEYFQVTFVFQAELRDRMNQYLKDNGKEILTNKIIEWVQEEKGCQDVEAK